MKFRGPSANRNLRERETRDLNLIPIMNLFLVLIPALLVMWVSVQLAMLAIDIGASAAAGAGETAGAAGEDKPEDNIQVLLSPTFCELRIIKANQKGKQQKPMRIVALDSLSVPIKYNFKKLDLELAKLKKRYPDKSDIELIPANELKYNYLLKTIDICKFNGFEFIKYSAAVKRVYQVN